MTTAPKIIVLDDDPTGSQTVHSCLLLLRWDVDTLLEGLRDPSPIVFILTNTRSRTPADAARVTREVCRNLKQAIAALNLKEFLVVSRSDSTLRGHYPLESDVIAQELGPFDAHFLVPAFFEGGRFTRESIHYLTTDDHETPVHKTEFARDSVFPFKHSYLPDYVEEKTAGTISAESVERFLLDDIRTGSLNRLLTLSNNQCGVVDGEVQADLDRFAADVLTAASRGKRFLFRSAASLLTSMAALPPQPLPAEDMGQLVSQGQPGVVLVGSHVQKTTEQVEQLLKEPGIIGVEVDVMVLLEKEEKGRSQLVTKVLAEVEHALLAGKTAVLYTSRTEVEFAEVGDRLQFGQLVSAMLMDIVKGLPKDIGFLVSKGGVTSNDTLSKGLGLRSVRLLGQILPGCCLVQTGADCISFPSLPVVLFPGNVGKPESLLEVYQRLLPAATW